MTVSGRVELICASPYSAPPSRSSGSEALRPVGGPPLAGSPEALERIGMRFAQVADELVALELDAARGIEAEAAVDLALDGRQRAPRLVGEARRQLSHARVE